MKLIIAGSRDFDNYDLLADKLDTFLGGGKSEFYPLEVVSGGARGADRLGERWADEAGCTVKRFLADWETHGKAAGIMRNIEMAQYADALLAFWDGKSKGTRHMILSAMDYSNITLIQVVKF